MIPFYFFRKKGISPMASLYHSGVMDDLDYWGRVDRLAVLEDIRHYAKLYALDWGLTCGLITCFMEGVLLLLRVLTGYYQPTDYWDIIVSLALVMLCVLMGANHIINQYQEALEFAEGGHE